MTLATTRRADADDDDPFTRPLALGGLPRVHPLLLVALLPILLLFSPLLILLLVCVIGLHSPHINITAGADTVARVCGGGRPECTVAMGDWNAPVAKRVFNPYTVSDRWAQLVGTPPAFSVAAPDVNSCCYPEVKYSGVDDHVVTDVPGARATEALLPYQMKDFSNDTEEHMPLLVNLTLPVAA